jgi:hypothetical protein
MENLRLRYRRLKGRRGRQVPCRAHDTIRGVGIVKLMGRRQLHRRQRGLGSSDVNMSWCPKCPSTSTSQRSVGHLDLRLDRRNHASSSPPRARADLFQSEMPTPPATNCRTLVSSSATASRSTTRAETGSQCQVHRPQLHDPKLAGQSQRLDLLCPARLQRRTRRHGGKTEILSARPGNWSMSPSTWPSQAELHRSRRAPSGVMSSSPQASPALR